MEFEVGISVCYLCSYYSFIIYNKNTVVLMVDTNKENTKTLFIILLIIVGKDSVWIFPVFFIKLESALSTQRMKFSIKYFFSECDQIRRKLQISSHWLKKLLMENFILCAVLINHTFEFMKKPYSLRTDLHSDMAYGKIWHTKHLVALAKWI